MTAEVWSVFTTFALGGFFGLVVIINPPATVPLFTALTGRRLEFERAHASAAGVTKTLYRIEAFGCAALLGKPTIDQGVTKLVG